MNADRAPTLSKSRFMAGLQCRRRLWWEVHEPEAPELVAAEVDGLPLLNRGIEIGAAARAHMPGGVLIDAPPYRVRERVLATAEAIASRAPTIYEASFLASGVFVSVDILQRRRGGFALVEVKATLDVKPHHIPDVAVQLHVLRRTGLPVKRAEVMHLNRDCRHPDLSTLFVRENVTTLATSVLSVVPTQIRSLRRMLAGPLPEVAIGPHCREPYECPFLERCWPPLPKHHISTLYRIRGARVAELVEAGYETLLDLPRNFPATGPARRQLRSVRGARMIVARGLGRALAPIRVPTAFLDFETIAPAIPVWPGCRSYEPVPVQFSCHMVGPSGLEHYAWLAEGPDDPREALSDALIAACRDAKTIMAYNAPFERRGIAGLITAVPRFAAALAKLSRRLRDLLPVVRNHVYHPDFQGKFGIKEVLPVLVLGLGYDDLEIQDGAAASTALEALLLHGEQFAVSEKTELRRKLLRYCERDTLAMVRLHQRLRQLANAQ